MLELIVAVVCFLCASMAHIFLCRRLESGKLQLRLFLLCSGVCFVLMLAVFWFTDFFWPGPKRQGIFIPIPLSATLFYILLIPSYLVFYFSTQQMSPSKKILLLLSRHQNLSRQDILAQFSDAELVLPRIEDLLLTGLLLEHQGSYVLTPQGYKMARGYELYQVVLGRGIGG